MMCINNEKGTAQGYQPGQSSVLVRVIFGFAAETARQFLLVKAECKDATVESDD